MKERDNFLWLVGLLEGEGSFMCPPPSRPNDPRVEIEMKDAPVIYRAAALLRARVQIRHRISGGEPSTIYRVRLSGKRAVALMHRLRPYLCARRRAQIDRALAQYRPRTRAIAQDCVSHFALADVCPTPMCPALRDECANHRKPSRAA